MRRVGLFLFLLSKRNILGSRSERVVQIVSQPHFGNVQFVASPALFGADLDSDGVG